MDNYMYKIFHLINYRFNQISNRNSFSSCSNEGCNDIFSKLKSAWMTCLNHVQTSHTCRSMPKIKYFASVDSR